MKDTPRSFSLQPVISLSGSDHNRSQRRPQSGIYFSQQIWPLSRRNSVKQFLTNLESNKTWHVPGKTSQQRGRTYISGTHDSANLLHRVQVGAQATVHGEDLLVNYGRDRQAVEAVGEGLPQLDVVSALALIVETIDTVDRGALVVTTQDEEVLGVLDLVGKEQADGLQGLLASVDVITEEEVVGLRGESTVFEQTQKVVVLAVNITTDLTKKTEKS